MAVRGHRKSRSRKVLVAGAVNPRYIQVARTIASAQGIDIEALPFDAERGTPLVESLACYAGQDITALVVQQPNYFGLLEEVDALADWAHDNNALLVAVVNPTSLAL